MENQNFYLFGCGKTTKAIAEILNINEIYDDNIQNKDSNCISSDILLDKIINNKIDIENSFLVPTPAIPPHNLIIQKFKNRVLSEYDLIAKYFKMPFSIWISGTNGKTTTTQMIAHLLQNRSAVTGGNIGTPLAKLDSNKEIWILETSSFSLHYTDYAQPNIYILLPITEDHISWHGNFEEYEQSKLKPIFNMREGEIAIIPKKYSYLKNNQDINAHLITYDNSEDLADYFDFDLSKINFRGGFLLDSLLSMAVNKILFDEVDYEKINSFRKDAHRQEELFDSKKRVWINDSKATNSDSTISFLEGINKKQKLYLILGGEDKNADLEPLIKTLSDFNSELFFIGKNNQKLFSFAKKYGIKSTKSINLENAVDSISREHSLNSIAVLSPACASFDQFKSYEHRGEFFKSLIKNI
jgi:UDP-N-acetylmuramoylalanine--D-glutamate ligase